uniref:SF3 helicase domain-containing protein n=1 Tax=viral metagenome TaxID=1070528 RepID=A0A6C0D908_9ZZZZ
MEDLNKLNPNKIRKYQSSVENFLDKYRVGPGSNIKYTHVAMGEHFTGKFMLDKKALKELYKLYSEAVDYGLTFSIAEKPKDYGPLLVDIDLEVPKDTYNDGRLYNEDMIFEIINTYREVAKEYLDLSGNEVVASVFEKPEVTKKQNVIKDGFHVIFHGICVHYKLRFLIRQKVVDKLKNNVLFTCFTKSINDIIDKAVVNTNCWLLVGSKKKDGHLYELKNIYDDENNIIDITKTLSNKYKLIKLYSLQDKLRCEENASTFLDGITHEDIEQEFSKVGERPINNQHNFVESNIPENKEDDIRRAKILVSFLSKDRVDSFDTWMNVGWALHNTDNSLLSTWIEFSKQSLKFKDGECEEKWYRMRNDGYTIRSLMYWAEEDNYQKYHEFIKQEFNDVLNKSLDGSTYFVAKALYTKFMERFVCADLKSNSWYEFRNHRWFPVHDGYTLKKEISESFVNEYLQLVSKYSVKATKLTGVEKDEAQQKASRTQKIVEKLMNISFKDKIMKEAVILFYDPNFEKKLDENYDLIGFSNGVYDLANNEFREGRPDDFISKNTNVDYYHYNESNPYASKMHKFFKEILPIESVRKYFLLSLASCVSGHNKEEKLRIATGSGSNGKSLIFGLVQQALGDYYISCPITIITRKRNSSNSASPELLRIKGTRCGCFQETDDGEKLNVGIMKEITGNDSFMVRGLYSDPIEIKPQIKFFLACNQLPELPSVDGGVKRRLCNILFGSKFVEKPVKPNEYLIDSMLKQKVKDWAPLFASYLVHLYTNEYKILPYLTEPDEVKLSTENYIAENDHFTEFFRTRILVTNVKSDSITIKSMYEDFKGWFKYSHEGMKLPTQIELNKYLYEKIGEPKFNKWKGYTFNVAENDNESGDGDEEPSALDC